LAAEKTGAIGTTCLPTLVCRRACSPMCVVTASSSPAKSDPACIENQCRGSRASVGILSVCPTCTPVSFASPALIRIAYFAGPLLGVLVRSYGFIVAIETTWPMWSRKRMSRRDAGVLHPECVIDLVRKDKDHAVQRRHGVAGSGCSWVGVRVRHFERDCLLPICIDTVRRLLCGASLPQPAMKRRAILRGRSKATKHLLLSLVAGRSWVVSGGQSVPGTLRRRGAADKTHVMRTRSSADPNRPRRSRCKGASRGSVKEIRHPAQADSLDMVALCSTTKSLLRGRRNRRGNTTQRQRQQGENARKRGHMVSDDERSRIPGTIPRRRAWARRFHRQADDVVRLPPCW